MNGPPAEVFDGTERLRLESNTQNVRDHLVVLEVLGSEEQSLVSDMDSFNSADYLFDGSNSDLIRKKYCRLDHHLDMGSSLKFYLDHHP